MPISPMSANAEPLQLQSDYRKLMMRELLIWLVGVPVPIAALIGLFVL